MTRLKTAQTSFDPSQSHSTHQIHLSKKSLSLIRKSFLLLFIPPFYPFLLLLALFSTPFYSLSLLPALFYPFLLLSFPFCFFFLFSVFFIIRKKLFSVSTNILLKTYTCKVSVSFKRNVADSNNFWWNLKQLPGVLESSFSEKYGKLSKIICGKVFAVTW